MVKISQNEKKIRQYTPLKDTVLSSFGLLLRELLDMSLC